MPNHLKHPSVRARANKTTTRAVLTPQTGRPKIPPLPTHVKWYPVVKAWWTRVWSSPMVDEWTASDVDALYLAAMLQQQFWDPETKDSTRNQTSAEIRQLMCQCGLTPMSRRSLQWEIQRVEEGADKAKKRVAAGSTTAAKKTAAARKAADPRVRRRDHLSVAK